MNHESWEHAPLIDPDEVHPPEDTELLIATGFTRQTKLAKAVLEYHTGDPELFLTTAQEQELAKLVQDGVTSESFLENVTEGNRAKYPDQVARFEASAQAGRNAQHRLIECNLRFAAYYARASMNIIAPGPDEADRGGSAKGKRIGTFSDVRALRSLYASLDDRIQIARLGLVSAARTFKPKTTQERKEPVGFLAHAAWHIHAALSKEIPATEGPGVHLSSGRRTELSNARRYPGNFTPEKLDDLAFNHSLTYSIPYDELKLDAFAHEEYEDDYTEVPRLTPAEVIGDSNETNDVTREVFRAILRASFDEILPTLSEREAGVIRLRFGLTEDASSRTLDEIGAVYGITRERVRQIESKTMSLLRHPDRSSGLTDYLDDDTTMLQQLLGSRHTLPERVRGVVNVHTALSPNPYKKEYLFRTSATDQVVRRSGEHEGQQRWQATLDDTWDAPTRTPPPDTREAEAKAEQLLASILKYADPSDFKRTPGETADYPWNTYEDIWANCGTHLLPHHIEAYWNDHIQTFIDSMQKTNGQDFDLDRVSLLFSALLAETMKDEDSVELDIPSAISGKLRLFGARLKQGQVTVNGDLGDYAGYQMSNLAQLQVNGSVGDYAAAYSSDIASLVVEGDTGDEFAHSASSEGTLRVRGSIKSLGIAPHFTGEIIAGNLQDVNLASERLASHITLQNHAPQPS